MSRSAVLTRVQRVIRNHVPAGPALVVILNSPEQHDAWRKANPPAESPGNKGDSWRLVILNFDPSEAP